MLSCDFSRSDGAGSATTRKTRGLTRSVRARISPLAGGVTPFEDDHDALAFVLYPFLEDTQLFLECLSSFKWSVFLSFSAGALSEAPSAAFTSVSTPTSARKPLLRGTTRQLRSLSHAARRRAYVRVASL